MSISSTAVPSLPKSGRPRRIWSICSSTCTTTSDSNFPKGYKIFYDLDGNVIKKEESYPNFDGTFEVGLSIYLGLGFTAKIGFDYEYFLQECGR